jgi:hypothetical protein
MRVFQASIEQMLWPERRHRDPLFKNTSGPGVGWIQRTTTDSFIQVPKGYIPDQLRGLLGIGQRLFPMFFRNGDVEIGPIPKGTPVSLVTSMDLLGADMPREERRQHLKKVAVLLGRMKRELKRGNDVFSSKDVMQGLLTISKCPDYVINKGHYFGSDLFAEEPGLSDGDKRDLIAFLKTM